jgi:6-phosphofructokinase 1
MVPIPDPKLGPRKLDITSMYDAECYRPKYDYKIGLPIFLTRP